MKSYLIGFCILLSAMVTQAQLFRSASPLSSSKLNKEFIMNAMRYPQSALEAAEQGKIEVTFTVLPDGTSSDHKVLKPVSEMLDEEAIRLVKKILWIPATENGQPVSERNAMTIVFNRKKFVKNQALRPALFAQLDALDADDSGVIYSFAALETLPAPMIDEKYRSIHHYLQSQLKYPETAITAGIQGKVTIDFVVEEDGIPSNIRLINSVGGGCDQEAIRLLQQLRWRPAVKNEKWVRSAATFDVSFILSDTKQQEIPNRQPGGL